MADPLFKVKDVSLPPHLVSIFLIVLVHFAFAFIGAATTLLGVILPALAMRFSLDDAQSGRFFSAQFAGSLLGTLLGERIWTFFGFPLTILLGLATMSAGIFGIAFFDLYGVVLAIFLNGIGIGLAIPATNLLVSALNPKKAASALNILNFIWSGGALVCPAFIGFLAHSFEIKLPLTALAASLLFLACLFIPLCKFPHFPSGVLVKTANLRQQKVWRTRFAFLIAALLFFSVGAENSLSGWLTAYSLRLQNSSATLWTASATFFWTAFLFGRLLAPFGLRIVSELKFIFISLLISLLGAGVLLIPLSEFSVLIATALAGFGLAPVFPTLFAQFTNRFGETGATKWLFVISTFGGAFLTWLVGFLSTANKSLRSGLAATFFCLLLMLILQFFLINQAKADQKSEVHS